MGHHTHRFARRARLSALLVMVALIVASAVYSISYTGSQATEAADIVITNSPMTQGRPLTPAGELVVDLTTRQPAVGALPVDFVRSPERGGADGKGRYLISVNSGFGVQFNSTSNRAQQSLAVIDLDAKPVPAVVQNVYFPTPQSVNVGVCFAPQIDEDGAFALYVSGGFENKIWMFRFRPGEQQPVSPASSGQNTKIEAPFIDVSGFARNAPSPRYNDDRAAVYPTGLAVSEDGDTLFVANNLGDSLGIINNLRCKRKLERIDLIGKDGARRRDDLEDFVYPYAVVALPTSSAPTADVNATMRGARQKFMSLAGTMLRSPSSTLHRARRAASPTFPLRVTRPRCF